jgi:transposase-like protein
VVHHPAARSKRQHFPGKIISHAVCGPSRSLLRSRDVEEQLAERGIAVSYETIGVSASFPTASPLREALSEWN